MNIDRVKQSSQEISNYQQKKIQANRHTVGLITGSISGTYIRIGSDLANVLDGTNMRVMTMLGRGSLQNINDILYLKGIDIGIVQGDALEFIQKSGKQKNIKNRIHYITKLYNEEVHLLASKDIQTLDDLKNEKVNFGKTGSGTFLTSSTIFQKLEIDVSVTNYDQGTALEKLRSGEISAMFFVVGKPASSLKSIADTNNLHILPIPYHFSLQDTYLPSRFSHEDYPNLIPPGKAVLTIATSAVMAVYNWPTDAKRYKKVEKFIRNFFTNIQKFSEPSRHPKWKEVSLTARLPGWTRFRAAEDILKTGSDGHNKNLTKKRFQDFLKQQKIGQDKLSKDQQSALFKSFLEWSKNK